MNREILIFKQFSTFILRLNIDFCKDIGLNVKAMEDDPQLQDAILSVHHAFMITLDATPTVKIIESQEKKSFVSSISVR